jgi:pimeloyl-ACP methyl ester carboxylesterase
MASTEDTQRVLSADGTQIAFSQVGDGLPLIVVEPAGHYRDFSSFSGLVPLLSSAFTVYSYDRRGRGESTDTLPYAPDREVEDLEALIGKAGGSACLYGFSSGALLALRVAAGGARIRRMALLEPPLQDEGTEHSDLLTAKLAALVEAGRNRETVEHFHRSIGVPDELIADMQGTPELAKMESVAHTFVYDCMISDAMTSRLLRSVAVPALVLDSAGSTDNLTGWAASVASKLPHGSHRSLAGEWHGVPDNTLAPVLIEFLTG